MNNCTYPSQVGKTTITLGQFATPPFFFAGKNLSCSLKRFLLSCINKRLNDSDESIGTPTSCQNGTSNVFDTLLFINVYYIVLQYIFVESYIKHGMIIALTKKSENIILTILTYE